MELIILFNLPNIIKICNLVESFVLMRDCSKENGGDNGNDQNKKLDQFLINIDKIKMYTIICDTCKVI